MARLNQPHNAEGQDGMADFSPLPAGDYIAQITSSEEKPTKDQKGTYHQLNFSVLAGEYAGKTLITRLNMNNASAAAVEIAYRELTSIQQAAGVAFLEDTEQLHGIPMVLSVRVTPGNAQYGPGNEVSSYAPYAAPQGQGIQTPEQPPQGQQQQQPPQGGFPQQGAAQPAQQGFPQQQAAPAQGAQQPAAQGGFPAAGAPQGVQQGAAPQQGAPQGGPANW